ncbi:MAG: hypothetical protein J0H69_09885 [Burkholderiales bacterium]|jgi:hypothetical protein|nr:hypothetical protein [Burkholderiales bacterium]
MQALRALTRLHRLVLIWFGLSLGAAIASPLVHPVSYEMICSGTTVKFIAQVDGESVEMGSMSMDCPLCVMTAAPPAVVQLDAVGVQPGLGHVMRSIPAARLAAITAAPLPARGPPAAA